MLEIAGTQAAKRISKRSSSRARSITKRWSNPEGYRVPVSPTVRKRYTRTIVILPLCKVLFAQRSLLCLSANLVGPIGLFGQPGKRAGIEDGPRGESTQELYLEPHEVTGSRNTRCTAAYQWKLLCAEQMALKSWKVKQENSR